MKEDAAPRISKPEIEHLELVFYLPADVDHNHFFEISTQCLESLEAQSLAQKEKAETGDRYRAIYRIFERQSPDSGSDCSTPICTVQIGPHQPKDAALRVILAPTKLTKRGLFDVQMLLDDLLMTHHDALVAAASITAIRAGFYIEGVTLDELIILANGKKTCTVVTSGDGTVQTLFLGSEESDEQLVFLNAPPPPQPESDGRPRARTRCEYRHQRSPLSFTDLATTKNPFNAVTISAVAQSNRQHSARFLHFLDSCRVRGPWSALALVKDIARRRKLKRKLIKQLTVRWWQPDHVWASVPAALHSLGLVNFRRKA